VKTKATISSSSSSSSKSKLCRLKTSSINQSYSKVLSVLHVCVCVNPLEGWSFSLELRDRNSTVSFLDRPSYCLQRIIYWPEDFLRCSFFSRCFFLGVFLRDIILSLCLSLVGILPSDLLFICSLPFSDEQCS